MTNSADPVRALIEVIRQRFTSGNSVPIERAHITAKEWSVLEAALAAQQQEVQQSAAVAAIQFALTDPEGMTFLRLWNEGEFDTLRREWPDAPSDVYVGADPLAAQQQGGAE